jgi:hypothetical protein
MIEFDEAGLPVVSADPAPVPEAAPRVEGTFQQRLYRALVDLADIVSVEGFFVQDQLVEVINRWSTDEPIPADADENPEGVVVGLDQMKLFHAIGHQDSNEETIEEHVLTAIKAAEDQPDWDNMDQIDIIIMEQERELTKNSQGVAYLTACLNQDPQSAHEIIDEMGCKLTHLLTQWFVLYMMSKEETEGDETSLQAVRRRVGLMGMENAKASALSPAQRREKLEEQVENFKRMTGFYDQEDGEGDAPQ